MKILFTGGGTGGLIFPIIAIIREIKKTYIQKDLEIFYIGPEDDYSLSLLAQEDIKIKTILTGKLRRYFSIENLLDMFLMPIGIIQALFWIFFISPDIIFSKGGYGSFPATVAGWILQTPIFLHESDATPGLSSRIESKWALEIFTSFPETEYFPKERVISVGNPIRKEILEGSKEEAKKAFDLQGNKPIVLIIGGSQGSRAINETVLEVLPELVDSFEIIHQTGTKNYNEVSAQGQALIGNEMKKYYHPYPFLNEYQLKNALYACDLVVSRAGSGAIFEISAAGKPAILIPLPSAAGNHQVKNAYQFAKSQGAEVIEEANLQPHFLLEKLNYLFSKPNILQKMAEGSLNFSKPRAAQIIANYLLEYLEQVCNK